MGNSKLIRHMYLKGQIYQDSNKKWRDTDSMKELSLIEIINKNNKIIEISAAMNVFMNSVQDILNRQKLDREEVQEAIDWFKNYVLTGDAVVNGRLSSAATEGWVKSLQVKSDINANASRVLDSVSKLIAASKNNDLLREQQSGGYDDSNLDKILEDDENGQ